MIHLLQGSAHDLPLADESVQCTVTSPPYWGQRDYGIPSSVWGGDPDCAHEWVEHAKLEGYTGTARWQHSSNGRGEEQPASKRLRDPVSRKERPEAWGQVSQGASCPKCGAWLGQLGLEPDIDLYVAHLVEVMAEVHRVLRKDGTVWLNIGDSYVGSWGNYHPTGKGGQREKNTRRWDRPAYQSRSFKPPTATSKGLKNKDAALAPFRVAIALQEWGWWVRMPIIWAKPNPMRESVKDRPIKAHEYILLLAKSRRYYYDEEATREPMRSYWKGTFRRDPERPEKQRAPTKQEQRAAGAKKGSVWTVATRGSTFGHFATFPEKLVVPCILAGTRRGDLVLDPFSGTGTVGKVAHASGRDAVLVDVSSEFLHKTVKRLATIAPLRVGDERPEGAML